MLLLLDENMDVRLEYLLAAEGLAAFHVETLGLKGTPDPELFRFAIENGYEALITKDAFRRDIRVHMLRALRDGLRIFRIRHTPKDPAEESDEAVADLILDHAAELDAALAADSPLRHLMLNARQRRITRTMGLPEVLAELGRLGG